MYSSYSLARVHAAENDWILTPSTYTADGSIRGVLWCHPAGVTVAQIAAGPSGQNNRLLHAIASVYPTLVCDLGGDTWGNATGQARLTEALTYLQGTVGAKSGKVLLAGTSMGHLLAFDWAIANPTLVQGIVGFLPVSDLDDIYQNNRGSYRAAIATAWGISFPTALPAGSNPAVSYAAAAAIPWRAYYASDDAIVIPATVTTLAGHMTNGSTVNLGTGGHNDSTLAAVDTPALMAYLATIAG